MNGEILSKAKLGFSVVALLITSVSVMDAAASKVGDAAMAGNKDEVRTLLAAKADVNAPLADGSTAIQWAAYNNDLEMADMLIAAGANVKTPDRDGATALSLACINGSAAMIGKLLKAGADPNERLPNGNTALMMASRTGAVDAIKVLLDHGARVNATENLRGTTALMWAAEQQHPDAVRLLIEHGANVNLGSAVVYQKGARPNLGATVGQRAAQVGVAVAGTGLRNAAAALHPGNAASAVKLKVTAAGEPKAAAASENPDAAAGNAGFLRAAKVGDMTALDFAVREGDMDTACELIEAKADVNKTTVDGWTPLLLATQNRFYKIGAYLLEHGADPNIANSSGWTPLYLATGNRNVDGGEYPVRTADMDHLDFIKLLLAHGADVNARVKDQTETRTNFTQQWLYENGATAFLRAAHSGDLVLMKLLLAHGADPKIRTRNSTTALEAAAGIGWVEGITYEWSPSESLEAVKLCLDLGIDVNNADNDGRTALHGAAHKGRNDVVQLLVDRGARLDARDRGSRDTVNGTLTGHGWLPVDYADGLVRVGVQSAIPHPETAALIRKLMKQQGIPDSPPSGATVCVTPGLCQ